MTQVLAIDLGGTQLRAAVYSGDVAAMRDIAREAAPSSLAEFTNRISALRPEAGDVTVRGDWLLAPEHAAVGLLVDPGELRLLKTVMHFPRLVESAAVHHEPHRIAFYLHDLASDFHALWNRGKEDGELRFLIDAEPELSRARLAMLVAVRRVVANGLGLMGVTPVAEMH
jgi:hypothetical protein